jgi:hypothetical protein
VFHLDVACVVMTIHACLNRMFQVFHLDVAKVDLDIAYIAMTIHVCFKCFICFRYMLQMFSNAKVILGLHNFFCATLYMLTYINIYSSRNLVTQTAMVMLGSIAKRKCCYDFFSLHFTLHEVEPNKIQP